MSTPASLKDLKTACALATGVTDAEHVAKFMDWKVGGEQFPDKKDLTFAQFTKYITTEKDKVKQKRAADYLKFRINCLKETKGKYKDLNKAMYHALIKQL